MDSERFRSHLEAIPEIHYQMIALRALTRAADPRPEPHDLLELAGQPEAWSDYLISVGSETPPHKVAELVRDGEGFKRRLLSVVERFWNTVYAQEFEATRALMERSVTHHRAQTHSPNFEDTFLTITGRLVPERLVELLPSVRQITFMPSCYVGPYVAYSHHRTHLILFYNCRSTPSTPGITNGTALYPPLKALADETRLQILSLLRGRELYAQEIVDQLDISQPAVSRHLNLMATAGLLNIRREGNAKYYSVDMEQLVRLAEALRTLV
jgi:DNA-binding HxlR family transcriptional regulator